MSSIKKTMSALLAVGMLGGKRGNGGGGKRRAYYAGSDRAKISYD